MSFTSNEYARVVAAIQSSTFSKGILSLLQEMIEQNEAHTVIERLVACERTAEQPDESAIDQIMTKLETLASRSEILGCILMAILWPIADNIRLHDVCDAIDLWIDHCYSNTLAGYLKAVADNEADADLKRHYATWQKEV